MLFLPSDNIFKFSKINDTYLLYNKGLFWYIAKDIEWRSQVSKVTKNYWNWIKLWNSKSYSIFLNFELPGTLYRTQLLNNPLKIFFYKSFLYLLKPFKLAIFSMQFVDNDNFLKVNQIFRIDVYFLTYNILELKYLVSYI